MKKRYGLLFLLCLLMFFCVNIDGVKADETQNVTTSNSTRRIQCFYTGEVGTRAKGQDGNKFYDVAIGISYFCTGNNVCSSTIYGRVADNDSPLSFDNYKYKTGKLGDEGFKKSNSGILECYDKLYAGVYRGTLVNKLPISFKNNGNYELNKNNLTGSGSWKEKVDAYIEGKHGSYSTVERGSEDYDSDSTINRDMIDKINKNAEEQEKKQKNTDIGITEDDVPSCYEVLGEEFSNLLKNAFLIISILGVILLIILMSIDFVKVITSGEADSMADAFKKSKNRIISVIILLLLPVLVNFIVNILNNNLHMEDGNITIGNVSECNITK